jgi:hypothetical protein
VYFRRFSINSGTSLNAYFCLSLWVWAQGHALCSLIQKTQVQNNPVLEGNVHALEFGPREKGLVHYDLSHKSIETMVVPQFDIIQN